MDSPREDVDPYAIIAQLQDKIWHYFTLVGDLGTQLCSSRRETSCLQHDLEQEQKKNAQTNIIFKEMCEKYDKERIERELVKYKEKAERVSGEVTSNDKPFEETVEIIMTRLKQENGTLIQQIEENIETHHRTKELCCEYRSKIEKHEKEAVMLHRKNSELELKKIGTCECTHSVEERTTFNILSLQRLVKMLEVSCCELKCRLGYTTENTGVQESGQDQRDQVVPTFSPPSQVVCEETGNSIEDYSRWMDMNNNDDFFYTPHAPPMLCPGSQWAKIKSNIRQNPRSGLKKVRQPFLDPHIQSGADENGSEPFVKMLLKASQSLPV